MSGDPFREPESSLTWIIPAALYVASASGWAHWLDATEFAGVGAVLGFGHPPGMPLHSLVVHLITRIPLGTLPFRAALASALCAGWVVHLTWRVSHRTLKRVGVLHPGLRRPLALLAPLTITLAPGLWTQAVRPEVYALQAALTLTVVDAVLHFEDELPQVHITPLCRASIALGLAFANHHYLALLIMPALAPSLARFALRGGGGPGKLRIPFLCAAAGLLPYLLLPLAAHREPWSLGDPDSWRRFLWVVLAEAFQGNTGTGVPGDWSSRWAQALHVVAEDTHLVALFMAMGGAYVLFRRHALPHGWIWTALLVTHLVGRVWLGFIRSNPDALGYLIVASVAVTILASAMIATVISTAAYENPYKLHPLTRALGWSSLIAVALWWLPPRAGGPGLQRFVDTDSFAHTDLITQPPGAAYVAHDPQTVFHLWYAKSVFGARPDAVVVPVPFLAYPNLRTRLQSGAPDLASILQSPGLAAGAATHAHQSVASERPLFVEMDSRVSVHVMRSLTPDGRWYRVESHETYQEDRAEGARTQNRWIRNVTRWRQGPEPSQSTRRLLWWDYHNALFHGSLGDTRLAAAPLERALTRAPRARELLALKRALAANPSAPLVPSGHR